MMRVPRPAEVSFADALQAELDELPLADLLARLEAEPIEFVPRLLAAVERAAHVSAVCQVEWAEDDSLHAYLFPGLETVTGTRALPFAPRVLHVRRDGSTELYRDTEIPPRQVAIWVAGRLSTDIDRAELKAALRRCGYSAADAEAAIRRDLEARELHAVDEGTVRL